jgi:ketosteroid isomerase-like protein
MRTATILALSVCAIAGAPRVLLAQATATDSIAVADAVRQFHEALTRGDSAAALALLADDAVVLEAGGIESRAEYRAHHLPADIQFATAVPAKAGPLHVVLAGDVAWVTSTSDVAGTFEGRAISSVGAELAVLTRTAEGWQIRAVHWSSRRRATP